MPVHAREPVLSVRCTFPDGITTKFAKELSKQERAGGFSDVVFDQIDLAAGTARLIGNIGVETVQAFRGDNAIHLVEFTGSGNLIVTTIFNVAQISPSNRVPVVHSRHVNLSGSGPFPSQYWGYCISLLP